MSSDSNASAIKRHVNRDLLDSIAEELSVNHDSVLLFARSNSIPIISR